MTRRTLLVTAALVTLALIAPTAGQLRVRPVADERGHAALGLALRALGKSGTVMMTTAHPDDENNALLAMMRYRDGLRTTLVSATRGDGGQNEIGPELFDALAVLRTEELLAAHRFDGAEQYFTRAVDFGYSFSIDETLQKWGHQEILGDFVRHIRTIRPDVIVGFVWDGEGGGQHHQASSRLTAEAFRAAADPARFPEQIAGGLRPWQAKKFYYTSTAGFGPPGRPLAAPDPSLLAVSGGEFDALLGRTYDEVAAEARSMHKCQGMGQLLPVPGFSGGFGSGPRYYKLQDWALATPPVGEQAMFDGIDTTLAGVAAFAGGASREAVAAALGDVTRHAEAAREAWRGTDRAAIGRHLAAGLTALRQLGDRLPALEPDEAARDEIAFRIAQEAADFERALLLARTVRVEALADDGMVMAGQPLRVSLSVATESAGEVAVGQVRLEGLDAGQAPCADGLATAQRAFTCASLAGVPAAAPLSELYFRQRADAARYDFAPDAPFGLPFRPTPFQARLVLTVEGVPVELGLPIQYRSDRDIFAGEKRMELQVVPAFAVRVTPRIAVVPVGGDGPGPPAREVRVTVTNAHKGTAAGEVRLRLPDGWTSTPAAAPVAFTREDEALTVRFAVAPPPGVATGEYGVGAIVRRDGASYDRGYVVVEYPHISRRLVFDNAGVRVKVLDVRVAPNLTVGYIMGVGDEVPAALEQLGARVEMIDADTLAWGDLSRYDVIMAGVRAYERRDDLRAYNQRLLDYAADGGTVLVQYNKFEFNDAQYAPYPARVGRERVTAEDSELRVLEPENPVFTTPNPIGADAWTGWVQERGLYFLGDRDTRYRDLVELDDPFPYNAGPKRGALVEAQVGQGRWFYLGLGLWRQLPAGTDGAYELLANLISLGRRPPGSAAPPQDAR
jgi:LmbE family N-acetylglucosaminyl deacetylase